MNRNRPRAPGRLPLWVALAAGALLLAASAGGLLSAAPAEAQTLPTRTPRPSPSARPTLSGIRVTPTPAPGSPTPIASAGGGCELIVTDDDLAGPGSVRVDDRPLESLPSRDPRYTYIRACEVVYIDQNGQIVSGRTFDGPIEACFRYTPDDVARAGGDPARLTIVYYDQETGQWVELEVVLDEANGLICGMLPRSGIVALVIRSGQLSGLPNTSGNLPEITPSPAPAAPQAGGAAPAAATPAPAAPQAGAPAQPGQLVATSAPAAAVAAAGGSAPQAGAAPAAPTTVAGGGFGPVLALVLGVAAAIFAVVVVLSRNMISRPRDE